MRFRPLVALLAGAAVPAILEAEAKRVDSFGGALAHARSLDDTDHDDHCPHDNLLRCLIGSTTLAYTFCSWSVGIYATPVTFYETVTAPATRTTTRVITTSFSTAQPQSTSSSSSQFTSTASASTVTVTQTVTFDHTQTTTDTVIQTVVSVVVTTVNTTTPSSPSPPLLNNATSNTPTTTTAPTPVRLLRAARTTPKTSLACLDDLQPAFDSITSACSCFASSQPTPTATSTVTWVEGAPFCPGSGSRSSSRGGQPLQQPTFPNCFADFHPYNCGTDHVGQIACSCALTSEGTAQCTLGDYERDNACKTSEDCAEGWYCTVIECFGAGVPSVCTKGCPVIFAPSYGGGIGADGGGGNDSGSGDNDTDNDNAVVSARPHHTMAPLNEPLSVNLDRNLSIIIVNNDGNGFGSGRSRGGKHPYNS